MAVHFSSATDDWATPSAFYAQQDAIHRFTLDACADSTNAKCSEYFSREQDGLVQDWGTHRVWMNPPYGREIKHWMAKAVQAARAGALAVCLIPARVDTAWWHDHAVLGSIRCIRGRLKFGKATSHAPFPSATVTYLPGLPAPLPTLYL